MMGAEDQAPLARGVGAQAPPRKGEEEALCCPRPGQEEGPWAGLPSSQGGGRPDESCGVSGRPVS